VSFDPVTFATRQLVPGQSGCDEGGGYPPAWSLNGERLAFVVPSHGEALSEIWVYEAASGTARAVAPCHGWCSDVAVSPDGSVVAYLDTGDQGPALVVTAIDSGESASVELIGSPRTPVFSPDGQHIALPLFGGRSGLYLVDVSRAAQGDLGTPYLLHGIVDASHAAWSPDGEWIAITQVGGLGKLGAGDLSPFNGQIQWAGEGIVAVRSDGSDVRILATGPIDAGPALPTWSADSSTVAYIESAGTDASGATTMTLSTVGLDGERPQRIWESECCIFGSSRPAWSPDGEWIALSVGGMEASDQTGTFLISSDGADVRFAPGGPWEPIWQPIPND
jgi:Tol biopolymer transport system component